MSNKQVLGQTHGKHYVSDHAAAVRAMTKQASRQLSILNFNLDQDVFDSEDLVDAVSALARKHRNSEIKILLVKSKDVVKRGHKLLKLQQRLSSIIKIKVVADDTGIKENFVVADDCGVIAQSIKNPELIWEDFNNIPVAKTYRENFELMWNNANESADLRILDI